MFKRSGYENNKNNLEDSKVQVMISMALRQWQDCSLKFLPGLSDYKDNLDLLIFFKK